MAGKCVGQACGLPSRVRDVFAILFDVRQFLRLVEEHNLTLEEEA